MSKSNIPGVLNDLGKILARLDGRKPTEKDNLRLADGLEWKDVLMTDRLDVVETTKKRLDPEPFSILLAALGALGSVASLAAYVEFRKSERVKSFKAKRSAIRAIQSLREAIVDIELALSDLEKLIARYDRESPSEKRTLDAPAEFGSVPPMFDFFEFSVYQMIAQRVTKSFDKCVSDTYEVMDCIEDGAIDVPKELFAELGELQSRLNELRYARRSTYEILSGIRHVCQRMEQIVNDFERFIAFNTAS